MFRNTVLSFRKYSDDFVKGFTLYRFFCDSGEESDLATYIGTEEEINAFKKFLQEQVPGSQIRLYGYGDIGDFHLEYDVKKMEKAINENNFEVVHELLENKNPRTLSTYTWIEDELWVTYIRLEIGSKAKFSEVEKLFNTNNKITIETDCIYQSEVYKYLN